MEMEMEIENNKTFQLKTDNTTKEKIQKLVKQVQKKDSKNADDIILQALLTFEPSVILEGKDRIESDILELRVKKNKKIIETQYTCKTNLKKRKEIQDQIKKIKKNINLNSDDIIIQSLKSWLKKEKSNE